MKLRMGPNTLPAVELAEQINCQVAGFFGNEDQNPPPEDVDDYEATLEAADVPHEFHRYENAGHAFQSFNSEDHYRHDVSEDAWEKALEFLQRQLSN